MKSHRSLQPRWPCGALLSTTGEQLCCCGPTAEPPAASGAPSATEARRSPRAAQPCRPQDLRCVLQAFCRALRAKGKRGAFSRQQPWILQLLTAG